MAFYRSLARSRADCQGISAEFEKCAAQYGLAGVRTESPRPEFQAMPRASNELSRDVACAELSPFVRTDAGPHLELLS